MEKLTNIEQFWHCPHFTVIQFGMVENYEFLFIHPYKEGYILALRTYCKECHELYAPAMIANGNTYVGDFDNKFIISRLLDYHIEQVEALSKELEKL